MSNSTSSTDDAWAGFKLWYYTPSVAAASIYTIIFILLTIYHTFRLIQRRTFFCIPFVIGGVFEVIGYVVRCLAHKNTQSVSLYAMQSILLLLAPILFAASVYMVLGRLIRILHGEQYSIVRVTRLTRIFVGSDVACFLVQSAGGGLLATAKTKSSVDTYNAIVLAGLCLQIVVFCLFVASAVVFQSRMQKMPTEAARTGPLGGTRWKKLMIEVYAASVMIMTRNIFRAVEYGLGYGNYLLSHEWCLYVFDGLLMIVVLSVTSRWYISELSVEKGTKMQDPELQTINPEVEAQNVNMWK